jgi:hypothetical protein
MEYDIIFNSFFNFFINSIIGKLAVFYFFFYTALGGFFCLYLSVFMSLLPLNQPRYKGKDSCLTSRAHRLSPGFLFIDDFMSFFGFFRTWFSTST